MEYLVRLVQVHESFRKPELEALAKVCNVHLHFVFYYEQSPFCVIRLPSGSAARQLISRSILSKAIYALWATGPTYADLHASNIQTSSHQWPQYSVSSFRFDFDTFHGSLPLTTQRSIISSFAYMGFTGPIKMRDPDETFTVFEEYDYQAPTPKRIYLGRLVGTSARHVLQKYSLKTREYINTTSMDSELAFLTANITMAAPDKLFYDPFVGTGSFPIACAHFGAYCIGSDIDGRMVRGREGKSIEGNFRQYGLQGRWMDGLVSDLVYCPLRKGRWLDGIICDPPYGIREGLKVLGRKEGKGQEAVFIEGKAAHLQDGYVAPKKAYSLEAMLGDILQFAAEMLVDEGRVSVWMPTANDEDVELGIPYHQALELVSCCVQAFNKWSRRLLTYRRITGIEVETIQEEKKDPTMEGTSANDLNSFRRRYFEGFKEQDRARDTQKAP